MPEIHFESNERSSPGGSARPSGESGTALDGSRVPVTGLSGLLDLFRMRLLNPAQPDSVEVMVWADLAPTSGPTHPTC